MKRRTTRLKSNLWSAAFAWNRRVLKLTRLTHGRLLPKAPTCFVASMPKSGSTFLATCLRAATGFPTRYLGDHFMSEQDVSEAALLDALQIPVIVHQHSGATKPSIDLIRRYGIKVVFQCRQVDDIIVSLRDKLGEDPWLTGAYAVNGDFLALPQERQIDQIISLVGARVVGLYAGWWTAIQRGDVTGRILRYEDILENKPGTVRDTLDFFGVSVAPEAAARAVEIADASGNTRLNHGGAGRGARTLTNRQRDALADFTAPYPWVDFTPVGLGAPRDCETVWTRPVHETDV